MIKNHIIRRVEQNIIIYSTFIPFFLSSCQGSVIGMQILILLGRSLILIQSVEKIDC